MAEDESLPKKMKFDKYVVTKERIDDIKSFLKMQKEYVFAIENFFINESHPRFSFLKIVESNSQKSCSFASTWCKTQLNLNDDSAIYTEKGYCLPFKKLFNVELLNDVLHERGRLETKVRRKQLLALEKLADFLRNNSDHADKLRKIRQEKDLKESDWAKVITTHLLSKLAIAEDITLDNEYATSSGKHCPCKCGTELVFEDTSMGHEDVWHGSVDILVGRSTVVTCSVVGEEDPSVCSDECLSDCLNKRDEMTAFESKVPKFDINQVLAESIVFSLTQRDRDFSPTVVITKDEMRVYIYEKKHDLLLESFSMKIFRHQCSTRFNPVFVLSLWFTLNYRYFTDETKFIELKPDEERFLYHADFFKDMPESKQVIYKQCLRFTGCKHVRIKEEPQTTMNKAMIANDLPISFAPVHDDET